MRKKIPDNLINKIKGMKPERYELNGSGNGRLFHDAYADLLRYKKAEKQWYWFDGRKWKPDTGNVIVERMAKELTDALSEYGREIEKRYLLPYLKNVDRLKSRRARIAMIRRARSE